MTREEMEWNVFGVSEAFAVACSKALDKITHDMHRGGTVFPAIEHVDTCPVCNPEGYEEARARALAEAAAACGIDRVHPACPCCLCGEDDDE